MKVVILCGGIGSRMRDYSMPKPLNMIYGKAAIHYVLANLPEEVKDLYFIYGAHLKEYNFEETILNLFKTKNCTFKCVEYLTRGPVETAYVGTKDLNLEKDESIVFLDNDNIFSFPEGFFQDKDYNFLGVSIDESGWTQYSFVEEKDGVVYNIAEKERISNIFCCGVYGFKNLQVFLDVAKELLTVNSSFCKKNEIYMSDTYRLLLTKQNEIRTILFKNQGNHIGSLSELKSSLSVIPKPKMRICFDLDNTLVTYPVRPGDYSTVKPIEKTIELARKLHKEGHTIVIFTARRMDTHKHNVGAAIKDIGRITFDTLEKFGIPYDELFFGKPNADVYIDDRGVNPYKGDYTFLGLFNEDRPESIINKLPNNKYNHVELQENKIVKTGNTKYLQGEFFLYSQLYKFPEIRQYFPEFYSYSEKNGVSRLEMEYIKGIPMYYLFKNDLVMKDMITQLINMLGQFHNCEGVIDVVSDNIKNNYITKLKKRFENENDYPFEDRSNVQEAVMTMLEKYISSTACKIVPFIHGDFWFSNIVYTFEKKWKCIDMKGQVDDILTTNGDPLYDYAKLYMSLLGYDIVLWDEGFNYSPTMKELCTFFEEELEKRNIFKKDLQTVTFGLIIGTLPFIPSSEKKKDIWNFLKYLLKTKK